MTPEAFAEKWKASSLSERSGYQEHWRDICLLTNQPTPTQEDVSGDTYTFEKSMLIDGERRGFADVWRQGKFAVEYKRKGKHKDLRAAYQQLLDYREFIGNPPLFMVTDFENFEVHTNFTGTDKRVYRFDLSMLAVNAPVHVDCQEEHLPDFRCVEVLRRLIGDPEWLKPQRLAKHVTQEAASRFSKVAESVTARGIDPRETAHFLMKVLFCLFAEDIGILVDNPMSRIIDTCAGRPNDFKINVEFFVPEVSKLFELLASEQGGLYLLQRVPCFNGGLFRLDDDAPIALTREELRELRTASKLDWSTVEPSIFGTLFERSLDPNQRKALGAHYTERDEIMKVIEPVVLRPLRREWAVVLEAFEAVIAERDKLKEEIQQEGTKPSRKSQNALKKLESKAIGILQDFSARLASVKVLDPACGSGNFLYVTLRELLLLEQQAADLVREHELQSAGELLRAVHPRQLLGMELNPYAHELAQVVVWIGYIQWQVQRLGGYKQEPILEALDTIQQCDALLVRDDSDESMQLPYDQRPVKNFGTLTDPAYAAPQWPQADFIVGNPPFLGGNKIRKEIGDRYVEPLFHHYGDRVKPFADLSAYWHERSREMIEAGRAQRAGLLATQGIRGGASQRTLRRIKETGGIFEAWSDLPWTQHGAAVHISIVCQDDGSDHEYWLDGNPVEGINADLTDADGADLTLAVPLANNQDTGFMGPSPKGPFDIDEATAAEMLNAPNNPSGANNSDVVRPVFSAVDLSRRPRGMWTIDFNQLSMEEAAQYELPFEFVKQHVMPIRTKNARESYAKNWWQYAEPRPGLRLAAAKLHRIAATPTVSKHRMFLFVDPKVLCNQQVIVFAREDDYFFGVLHSVVHELWSLALGTQLREKESGFRYTPTTCFETFPLPKANKKQEKRIADAAKKLNDQREAWLNPPDASEAELKKRTLTKLYNQRPTWLHLLHLELDAAVLDAYGWSDLDPQHLSATKIAPDGVSAADEALRLFKLAEKELLKRLLNLNIERSEAESEK